MYFELTDSQKEIVAAVRALCQRFPDEYWRGKDSSGEFPHEFYQAVAAPATSVSRFPRSTAAADSVSPRPL